MADYQTEHEDEGGGDAPTQEEPAPQPGKGSTQSKANWRAFKSHQRSNYQINSMFGEVF